MRKPKVAVLVPAYNAAPYVRETLLALRSQREADFATIVVDDGSTDGTSQSILDLCDDRRIRLVRQSNIGKPATINRVAREIDADVLILNDADDLSHPDRVARISETFAREPDLAGVYSGYRLLLGASSFAPIIRSRSREQCHADIGLFRMPGNDATAAYRVETLREFPLAEDLPIGEGLDLALRMGEAYPMRVIGDCLLTHRVHPTSITRSDPARAHRFEQETLRRACARRGIDFERTPLFRGANPRATFRNAAFPPDLCDYFCESVLDSREAGHWIEGFMTVLQCVRLRPLARRSYRALAYLLAPRVLHERRWSRRDAALRDAIESARLR